MKIRKAQVQDIPEIIDLLWIIFTDMELPILKEVPSSIIRLWIEKAMSTPGYRYNLERILVADVKAQVAGIAVFYPAVDENGIDDAFNKIAVENGKNYQLFFESEAFEDEWYLESLVVNPNYRGQGVATNLIKALITKLQSEDVELLGLNVDINNPKAKSLYTKIGFEKVGMCVLANHSYEHLQYKIKNNTSNF